MTKTKKITVKMVGSPAGCSKRQRLTLKGLGLGKMHQVRDLEDSASVRGMVKKIPHLVSIVS